MIREGLRLLEQSEQERKAKLKWLRTAVREGMDQIGRGEYTELHSGPEIEDFVHQIGKEASGRVSG